MLASLLLVSALLFCDNSFAFAHIRHGALTQQYDLRVRNLNTDRSYATIQEAIDASETLDGHQIFVSSGTYRESVTVNKSVSLIGEARDSTIVDGNGASRVIYVIADNVEIKRLTIQNGTFGLWLHYSDNSKIIDNALQDGSYGIRLYHSQNTRVTRNTVRRYTFFGFEIDSSGNSTLRNNSVKDNRYNFGVDGKSFFDFINDIDASNTVNGKPIRYLINQHDVEIDSGSFQEMGYLGLVNATNIKVQNLNVQDNIQGVLLAFAKNCTVTNVNAKNNWNGIYVTHSSNITARENNANYNFDYGIKFFNSSQSTVSESNVDNNGWAGIGLFGSPNSVIEGNEASFCTYNLHVVFTNNSVITRNTSFKKPGGYSIAVYYSHNNSIYHNVFENTLLFVETRNGTRFTPGNIWDNGLEGNYWTTYGGGDADYDGLGDTPRAVGEKNIDNNPLMGKFTESTLTLEGKAYSIAIISNSTITQFQFSPDDGKVSFIATGEKGTKGFSRIAVPNAFLQDLHSSNLAFLINGKPPILKRSWMDGIYTYWYFSYANSVPELGVTPWLIVVLVAVFLILFVLVFVVFRKRY
jgi:parallel beta-helix repeat protein